MKNLFTKFKSGVKHAVKPVSNDKGMELVQMIGIAAIAIVLISVAYVALDGSFDQWFITLDTNMDNLIGKFNITTP